MFNFWGVYSYLFMKNHEGGIYISADDAFYKKEKKRVHTTSCVYEKVICL